MKNSMRPEWLAAAAALSFAVGAGPAASTTTAARNTSPPPAASDARATNDASLAAVLERSEVGELGGLLAARAASSDPGVRAVIDVRLAAARLDLQAVRRAMRRVDALRVPATPRAMALAVEAGAAFAAGDYELCASDSATWLRLPEGTDPIHGRADIAQMLAIAQRLADLPPQAAARSRAGSSPTWRDRATLVRTNVVIGGVRQEAVLDTGANLSVISESTARRLGLAVTDGASVRSSSRDAVLVRLAVAQRLDIAGTTFTNVAFLVLKDADLALPLPGGYEIPAIIGFPVLRALGRITFSSDTLSAGNASRLGVGGAPLVASGSDLFVRARVNGEVVPLHLDSGASRTSLGQRFAFAHSSLVAHLERRTARSAGAGGAVEESVYVLKDVVVGIGAAKASLPAVDVSAARPEDRGNYGVMGQDVLRSSGRYTVDFGRMTLTLQGVR